MGNEACDEPHRIGFRLLLYEGPKTDGRADGIDPNWSDLTRVFGRTQ